MKLFIDRLIAQIKLKKTPCIVGLDPALSRMPPRWLAEQGINQESSLAECAEAIYQYNLQVLDAIADLVPGVKPQSAYYELFGSAGILALEKTVAAARDRNLLVILDVKRGDIASTATAYAQSYLPSKPPHPLEADAITIVPYLGQDCLEPFFTTATTWGKGILVCVKTSNPGAAIIQEQSIDGRYLYEIVADLIKPASEQSIGSSGYSGIGAVVGATYPEAAQRLRQQLPHSLFLVPGVGAQGGGSQGIKACFNSDGLGAVVSSSRAIMYPHLYGSADSNQQTIRQAALDLITQVNTILDY
ncbi:MAG: orotidine-5'-phosphate decarboxylase [Cyanobacteria bacterium J06621_8]